MFRSALHYIFVAPGENQFYTIRALIIKPGQRWWEDFSAGFQSYLVLTVWPHKNIYLLDYTFSGNFQSISLTFFINLIWFIRLTTQDACVRPISPVSGSQTQCSINSDNLNSPLLRNLFPIRSLVQSQNQFDFHFINCVKETLKYFETFSGSDLEVFFVFSAGRRCEVDSDKCIGGHSSQIVLRPNPKETEIYGEQIPLHCC